MVTPIQRQFLKAYNNLVDMCQKVSTREVQYEPEVCLCGTSILEGITIFRTTVLRFNPSGLDSTIGDSVCSTRHGHTAFSEVWHELVARMTQKGWDPAFIKSINDIKTEEISK